MSAGVQAFAVNSVFCRGCGQQIHAQAEICPGCGVRQASTPALPAKSKGVAVLLCLFLGGMGAHKFYLGQTGLGLLYLLFCWTFIPAVIALLELVVFLCMSEASFAKRYA